MPHRCAFGCKDTSTVMHVFPNPDKYPERFQAWVQLIGGKLETSSDYELYKKKRICDIHFTDHHRNRFKRLNNLAIPTLNLPGSSSCQQSGESGVAANTCERQPTATASTDVCLATKTGSCTSLQSGIAANTSENQSTVSTDISLTIKAAPCTSQQCTSMAIEVDNQNTSTELPFTTTSGGLNVAAAVLKEHSYSVKSRAVPKTFKDAVTRTTTFNYAYLKPMKMKINYLRTSIITFVDILIDDPFNCAAHKQVLKKYFKDISINVIIFSWCRSINRILSGKIIYTGPDETKTYAQNYYNKHKNYKNRK